MRIMMVVGFLWMSVVWVGNAQEVRVAETAQDTQKNDFSKNNIRLAVMAALQDRGMEPLDLDFGEVAYWEKPFSGLRSVITGIAGGDEDIWRADFRVSGEKHLLPHDLYYSCWVSVDLEDRGYVSYSNPVQIINCSVSGTENYSDQLFLGRVFLTSEPGVFDHESW